MIKRREYIERPVSITVIIRFSGAHSHLCWGWDQGWGKEPGWGRLAASHALTWTRTCPCVTICSSCPANHLRHDWSLSLVNSAGSACFLSQCAPSIYWPFVTMLVDHHSFQLNEQHSHDSKYKVHQIQQKNPFHIGEKKKSLTVHFIYEKSVWIWKAVNKKVRLTSFVRLLWRQTSGPVKSFPLKNSLNIWKYDCKMYLSGSLTLYSLSSFVMASNCYKLWWDPEVILLFLAQH